MIRLARTVWFGGKRFFSVSGTRSGLEEFFPQAEQQTGHGRSWFARELRHKSNEDLHKLWYVLLKERNMLLTVRHECARRKKPLENPERMKKVKKSMARILVVLGERERARNEALEATETVESERGI